MIGAGAYVPNLNAYSRLWKFACQHFGVTGEEREEVSLSIEERHPFLPDFLSMLAEAGWTPLYAEFVPAVIKHTHFQVLRIRKFEKRDLENAEYLSVFGWSDMTCVFRFHDMAPDGQVIGKVARAKWKTRYGLTQQFKAFHGDIQYASRSPYFVNDELKRDLEAAELRGLVFRPVVFDHPEKAKGEFWQVDSSIIMPPCRLPVVAIPDSPGTRYDDKGHRPAQLVFRQDEVRELEPFDVALTHPAEIITNGQNSWTREIIVSQRCRRIFNKLKMGTVTLVPVVLE